MQRLLAAMAVMVPGLALAVTPVNGTAPTLTPVTINAGPGDQYDPHVSGDFAAYTSDSAIRYYSFLTAADAAIPMGSSARDLLSDVSGSRVVFSRVITAVKTAVMVFDINNPGAAPIELDAAVGSNRIGSAIGGNTVAYIDFGVHPNGEVVIHDLATSTSLRITNDSLFDQNPSVSPDGNVVTWEHCATSTTNCDIWQAVRAGPGWTAAVAVDSTSPEANPDTNGSLVVYDSIRGTDRGDIFWRPVGGGPEVQLLLPSVEANPSIAGNFIAFESRATLFSTSDIFVYDITANRLFQITNTSLVTEQLNDITLLPNGSLRVVWGSDEDGFDSRNVKGATFTLTTPPPPPPPTGKKVVLCHVPPGNHHQAHTIKVGRSAVAAHLAHGDKLGACKDHDDDDDDDGDDDDGHGHGEKRHDLSAAPDAKPGPMGCSSTGGAPVVLMLAAVGAWLVVSRRRPAPVAVRSRR